MNIKELIYNVDRTNTRFQEYLDIESICSELSIPLETSFDIENEYYQLKEQDKDRLKAFYLAPHYCTDSFVGVSVLFLDETPVGIITQIGRKCEKKYQWISKDLAKDSREYLLSLKKEKDFIDSIELVNLEKEVHPLGYRIEFAEQLLQDKVFYKEELYDVITKNPHRDVAGQTIRIKKSNSHIESIDVCITECIVPYNIKGN